MLITKQMLDDLKKPEIVEMEIDFTPPGSDEKAKVRIKKLSVGEADEIQKPFLNQNKSVSMGELMLSVVTRCLVGEDDEPLAKTREESQGFSKLPLDFVKAVYDVAVKVNPFGDKEEVEDEAKN